MIDSRACDFVHAKTFACMLRACLSPCTQNVKPWNQSIRANLVNAKIDKSQKVTLCRLCKKADESIDHVVGGCSKLAQKEYKRRHDNLGRIVHWKHARKCNFEAGDKW